MGVLKNIRSELDCEAVNLLDEYRERLSFEAQRLCGDDHHKADDLVMRTFETYFLKRESYDPAKGPLLPWLKTIMRNLHADAKRNKAQSSMVYLSPEEIEFISDMRREAVRPEEGADWSENELVRKAIDELPEKVRTCVLLRYYDSLSTVQIAKVLAISPDSVRSRLCYANKILARRLGKKIKKPLIAMLAIAFSVAALFGAWKAADALDWLPESEEPQVVETPSSTATVDENTVRSAPSRPRADQSTSSPTSGREGAARTVMAPAATAQPISNENNEETKDMNLKTVKTMAAAAATAMALTATAETTIPANAYIQDGLVVQFDAIENAGSHTHDAAATVWKDLSGNGRDATLNSYYAGCWTANSLVMNNSLYASFVTNFPGSFTVEIICSAPFGSAKSTYNTLFCAKDDNYSIFKNSAALTFKQAVASSRPSIAGYNGSSVVAQIDGKTVSIGYQGEQFYSMTGTAISSTGNRTWCIGGADGSHALTGEIFAVRVYGRALTADEIAYNMTIDKIRYEGADPSELLPSVSPEMFPDGVQWSSGGNCLEYSLSLVGEEGATMSFDNVTFESSASEWFAHGSSVTVYARPAAGQSIAAWRGAPADAQISADMTSATFAIRGPVSISTLSHAPTTLRWRGGSSTLASDMANWAKDDGSVATSLPLDGDAIMLDASSGDMTWDLVGVRPGSWTQEVAYAGTVTFDTGLKTVEVSGDVSLQGGTWKHTDNPSCTKDTDAWRSTRGTKQLIVSCGGKFDFGANAMIDVTGCGYRAHQGPGSNVENGNQGGASGCYGGAGVVEGSGVASSRNIGNCYGSAKTPDSLGSGGNGSAGGGAVRLTVAGKLTLDGSIVADGDKSSSWYSGSGGSIYLTAGSVAGTGTLRAAGGDAQNSACGGGGRIALYVTDEGADYEEFAGTFDVSATLKGMAPFCGTVYREKKADNGRGELWIKGYNASVSSIPEPMTPSCQTKGLYGTFLGPTNGTMSVGTLRMSGHSRLHVPSNVTLSVQRFVSENDGSYTNLVVLTGGKISLAKDAEVTSLEIAPFWEPSEIVFDDDVTDKTLTISDGGRISPAIDQVLHGDLHLKNGGSYSHYLGYPIALTVPGDCTIDVGGAIDVSGRGYVKDTGPGKSTVAQTGGSHGGRGNGGNPTGDNGPGSDGVCYGSVTAPVTMGSGGRYGTGGGAIKLTVADTLTVNGAINADGGYSAHYSGAGGSAWILTKRLLGLGPISANGGLVSKDGQCNGTGGGGRVAVWMTDPQYDFSEYAGAITAYGGSKPDGKVYGGAGTVYRKLATEAQNEGTLVIDNGLTSQYKNYECRVDPLVTDADVGTVIVTNNATFAIVDGATFTFRKAWIVGGNARFRSNPGSTVACAPCGATATISGTNTFYNFICEAPGKTLRFDPVGSLFQSTALANLVLRGDESAPLALVSKTEGDQWWVKADPATVQDLQYLAVTNSNASLGALMVAKDSSGKEPDANNANWNFVNVKLGEAVIWTGANGSSFSDGGNWDICRPPEPTDNIVVPAGTDNAPVMSAAVEAWSVTVAAGASLDLNGYDLSVSNLTVNGTLKALGKETLTVKKDIAFAASSFDAKRTTIVLEGAAAQALTTGGNTLYDVLVEKDGGSVAFADAFAAERLYVQAHGQLSLTFAAGEEVKARELSFDGLVDGAAVLKLASSTPGTEWRLTATDYAYATGVTVSDSNASGGHWFHTTQPSSGTGCSHWTFGETAYVWTGAAGNEFSNPLNWAGNAVPDENARVRIDSAADIVVNAPVAVRELSLYGSNGAIGFTNNAPITVGESLVVGDNVVFECNTNVSVGGSVLVKAGGTITHVAAKTDLGQYVDIVAAGNMAVEEGGRIDVRGMGYTLGPGRTSSGSWYGPNHGGLGSGDTRDEHPAPCYDSIVDPRMGGSSGWTRGGGVVYIRVSGTLTVDGDIDARGVDRMTDGCYCGSGGTINLTASSLVGGGTLNASAGLDAKDRSGSGGRIAVHLTGVGASSDDFAGKILCYGGYGYQAGQTKHPGGSAGTIYVEDATSKGRGTVTIDNDGASASYAEKFGVQYPVPLAGDSPRVLEDATFVVTNGGSLMLTADCRIGDLDLKGSSSRLMLNGHVLQISTRRHRNQKGWTGKVVPGVDANGNPGKIVWLGGFMMFIR